MKIKNKYAHHTPSLLLCALVATACLSSGCDGDNSLYEKYPGYTCRGFCVGTDKIDNEIACKQFNGTWNAAYCRIIIENKDAPIPTTETECVAQKGAWKNSRCDIKETQCKQLVEKDNNGFCAGINIMDETTCTQYGGTWNDEKCEITLDEAKCQNIANIDASIQWINLEWRALDYQILDLGDGNYIRCMSDDGIKDDGNGDETHNKLRGKCTSFACGTMTEILSSNPPPCDPIKDKIAIADMAESYTGSICQANANTCVEVTALGDSPAIGMCSTCPQDNVVCNNRCVNPLTDINHCGKCDNPCDVDEELCVQGSCKSKISIRETLI